MCFLHMSKSDSKYRGFRGCFLLCSLLDRCKKSVTVTLFKKDRKSQVFDPFWFFLKRRHKNKKTLPNNAKKLNL